MNQRIELLGRLQPLATGMIRGSILRLRRGQSDF